MLELHGYGVNRLVVESRTLQLDRRDVATVTGARIQLPRRTPFRVEHQAGADEPLLWAADIVAGAVRACRQGHSNYRRALEECVYEIDVVSGC